MYHNGNGVKEDHVEAMRWCWLAAEQGYAKAQYNIGVKYYNGHGMKQDHVEAVRWFRLAADQGYANAIFNLGVSYCNGEGVKQDLTEALRWFRKAADHKHPGAMEAIQTIERELSEQQPAPPQAPPQAHAPSQSSSSSRACANCGVSETGSVALKPCSRCKAVVYCGKDCQARHWKAGGHRDACK